MDKRPIFLDVLSIKLPVTAICSILHRISGIVMILTMPIIVGFAMLLFHDQNSFDSWLPVASSWWMKVIWIGLAWAWSYHIIAGVKHMFHDFTGCHELSKVRLSSWLSLMAFAFIALAWVMWIGWYS